MYKSEFDYGSCSIDTVRLKHYMNGINDKKVKQLLVECVDDDPSKRPSASIIYERIKSILNGRFRVIYSIYA